MAFKDKAELNSEFLKNVIGGYNASRTGNILTITYDQEDIARFMSTFNFDDLFTEIQNNTGDVTLTEADWTMIKTQLSSHATQIISKGSGTVTIELNGDSESANAIKSITVN